MTDMRIRQIALVARDMEPVVDGLCAVFDIAVAFRDPGIDIFGLRKAMLPVGDTFLEIVSPVRADTTAGRVLDRRGGDTGYMVILQTANLADDRARLAEVGVRIVWEITLDDIVAVHLHPRRCRRRDRIVRRAASRRLMALGRAHVAGSRPHQSRARGDRRHDRRARADSDGRALGRGARHRAGGRRRCDSSPRTRAVKPSSA